MSETSFTGFFNTTQRFGLNVKVPERTLKQIGKTTGDVAGGVLEPIFNYLEKNENVFSGNIEHELNRIRTANFNTTLMMDAADEKVNGPKPKFDTLF